MKKFKFFLSGAIVALLVTGCTKKMQDYDGVRVIDEYPESNLVTFEIKDYLTGVADNEGKIIIKPEYDEVEVQGKFITATKCEETEAVESEDDFDEFDFGGNNVRLYTVDGKMLKDFEENAYTIWDEAMGDTILWAATMHDDPSLDVMQLVSADGETTDIEEFNYGNGFYTYKLNGTTYFKRPGEEPSTITGQRVTYTQCMYISHDYSGRVNRLRIYTDNGAEVSFDDWLPIRYIRAPGYDDIFVKLVRGDITNATKYSGEQKVVYVNQNGISNEWPKGYSLGTRGTPGFNEIIVVIKPNGRAIEPFDWHD